MSSDLGERPNANGRGTVAGTDTNTETTNTSTLASTADAFTVEPAARGKLLGTIPLNRGDYEVCEEDLARDAPLYPGVDVLGEYRKMKAWALADLPKRKTRTGIRKFMHSWLSDTHDRSRIQLARPQPAATVGIYSLSNAT